jgi:NAD(P)-dependent dehydrogenase (short-subunit alcohol dehydrogenase family)
MSMDGKVCIVTGSNTGIGKETARALAAAGATVVMACRNVAKAEEARADVAATSDRSKVEVMTLDLGSLASIRAFAAAFKEKHPRLDVLVNNAGIMMRRRTTTADGFESTFGVNHLGTMLLTLELLDHLEASAPARIVVLTSALHYSGHIQWDDLMFERGSYSGSRAYNQSKLANVLFTRELAKRLEGKGVSVNAVHPGVVQTELSRQFPRFLTAIFHLFTISPAKGAETSLHVAMSPETARVTGEYFEKSQVKKAAAAARDPEAQKRLWEVSERLLGRVSQ